MKKRLAKKMARKYYNNKLNYSTSEEGGYGMNGNTIKVYAELHPTVSREVINYAYAWGWDGNHWDNPLVVEEYEN